MYVVIETVRTLVNDGLTYKSRTLTKCEKKCIKALLYVPDKYEFVHAATVKFVHAATVEYVFFCRKTFIPHTLIHSGVQSLFD